MNFAEPRSESERETWFRGLGKGGQVVWRTVRFREEASGCRWSCCVRVVPLEAWVSEGVFGLFVSVVGSRM